MNDTTLTYIEGDIVDMFKKSVLTYIEGDIVDMFKKSVKADTSLNGKHLLIHFTNCCCNLEIGVARKIIESWPRVQDADWNTKPRDALKLGTYSFADVYVGDRKVKIVSCYSQFGFHTDNSSTDIVALRKSLEKVKNDFCKNAEIYMTMPRGHVDEIKQIISEIFEGYNVTIVNRKPVTDKKKIYLNPK